MSKVPFVLIFISLSFWPEFSNCFAGNVPGFEQLLISRADSINLSSHPGWMRLMHYESGEHESSGVRSFADDEKFFLSEKGKYDSKAELKASIRRMISDRHTDNQEEDPRCRFVERFRWLREMLQMPVERVPDHCESYHEWRSRIQAHSVTLVFPASYLNSPSSMFGHTLLRFDPEDIDQNSSWLSYALSFAADVGADEEGSFGYAFKGITGGYAGRFNIVPYFQKIQDYGAIENRDVWEYRLNLTPREVRIMLDHAWELHDIRFDYYFFRENCSFRLLELLDYARPSLTLTKRFNYTAIPANTVKAVVESGIVSEVKYRPSIGTQLQFGLSQLSAQERDWVVKIEQDSAWADSAEFSRLEESRQHAIVLAANQLVTYRSRRSEMTEAIVKKRFKMLQKISLFPPKKPQSPPQPARPESGHETRRISLGVGKDEREYADLGFRISYHDLTDNIDGYLKGGEIQLGNLTLRQYEDERLKLQSLDIIQIRSLSAWYSVFRSISWEAGAGLVRKRGLEDGKLSFRLNGSIGKSALIGDKTIVYGLLGPSINLFHDGEHDFYLNAHLKTGLLNYNQLGTAQIELSAESLQHKATMYQVELLQNIAINKNHGLRVSFSESKIDNQHVERVQFAYRYYF